MSAQQQRINDLAAQLAIVSTRLSALDGALQVQRVTLQRNASALALALEQLRDEHPCTLECEHGGEPELDCLTCTACDAGWAGSRCHVPVSCVSHCAPDDSVCRCEHGGELDASTCECRCAPGWTGQRCLDVDANVAPELQVDFLAQLLGGDTPDDENTTDPHALMRALAAGQRVPSTVGYGRRPITGRLTLPLLALDQGAGERYVDPRGQAYTVPWGVRLDEIAQSVTLPPAKHEVFPTISDWMTRLFDWSRGSTVVPSPLAMTHTSASKVFDAFFASGASLGMTAVQVPLYSTKLRADVTTYPLASHMQQALDYLAGMDYPGRKDLYYTFLDHVGTSVVVSSLAGGSVERLVRFKGTLWNDTSIGAKVRDNSWVKEQLEISWSGQTGQGSWTKEDKRFTNNVDYARQICRGGTSVEVDCGSVNDLNKWRQDLWLLPVAVVDTVVPVTRLVKNPELAQKMTRALNDYIADQNAHYGKPPKAA